jgi:hypothetical protein
MATKPKRRGGWPKRKRAAVICRVHPDVSTWLDNMAAGSGRSKSSIIERWITSLCEIIGHAELNWSDDSDPLVCLPALEHELLQALIDLGLPDGFTGRILDAAIEASKSGVVLQTGGTLDYSRTVTLPGRKSTGGAK